jgi:predicted GNAT family acetyltransferase
VQLEGPREWEWFAIDAEPAVVSGEEHVGWLDADRRDIATEITDLLRRWSGRHDAEPGAPQAVAWCGIRLDGRLVAVAAHTEHVAGVPFLASIVTDGEHRGRGYGAAVTAWLTRSLLRTHSVVALGMYSDNDGARRIYLRLGYGRDHEFTSGRLVRR